jgi:hypothetical protein
VWTALLREFAGSLYLFGHGIGTSSQRVDVINPALGHPHNDFLRYFYDLGAFGLGLYVLYLGAAVGVLWSAVRRAARDRHPDVAIHMAPLLGLAGFMIAMCTDNPVTYIFVVAPLSVLVGCSLGLQRARALADEALAAEAAERAAAAYEMRRRTRLGGHGGGADARPTSPVEPQPQPQATGPAAAARVDAADAPAPPLRSGEAEDRSAAETAAGKPAG